MKTVTFDAVESADLSAINAKLDSIISKIGGTVVTPPPPTTTTKRPSPDNKILQVGQGKLYATFADACASMLEGDTIQIYGQLVDDSGALPAGGTVIGMTPDAGFKWTKGTSVRMAWGKGFIVATKGAVAVQKLEFQGMAVSDNNGSGVRADPNCTSILVEDCYFHDGQEGLLVSGNNADVMVRRCKFDNLGAGDGLSHCIYGQAQLNSLTVEDSTFTRSKVGHQIKSRARKTVVTRCILADIEAPSSYNIDCPNAGEVEISHCVIEQGPNGQNNFMLTFGVEGMPYPTNKYSLHDCLLINDKSVGYGLNCNAGITAAMVDIHDNKWIGVFNKFIQNGTGALGANNVMFATHADAGIEAYPVLPSLP